jgi:small subunit ribosomal protein S1
VVLENALGSGDKVTGIIRGFNRGGCLVDVEGVQGFVPMSQLVSVVRENPRELKGSDDSSESEKSELEQERKETVDESKDIGRELPLKVLELDRGRNRAIFSERRVVHEQREEQRAKLIADLDEGEIRKGKVTGISSFGAFVDLGGADGLIHVSELSWNQVRSPEEIVSIGDEIDVYVLKIDTENKKIALSLRRLQPEPWQNISERHQVGDLVDATVTKLTNFGAFARIQDSVEGLIHISELTSKVVSHPKEVVKEGDNVRLRILRIEPERRRLGLSLKQMDEEEF